MSWKTIEQEREKERDKQINKYIYNYVYIYTHYSNIISTYIQITFAAEFANFYGQGGALASELVYLIGKQLGRWQQSW
jgi:hypothetical protein